MAYTPLLIPAHVGPAVREVVRSALDLWLHDVHTMLRLPHRHLTSGCNFVIAGTLFGIIEGVSAVLAPRRGDPKASFVECVLTYYPPETTGTSAVNVQNVAAEIYDLFRSPMRHCLGLALDRPNRQQGVRPRLKWTHRPVILRDKKPASRADLRDIESSAPWPKRLGRPTLQKSDSGDYFLSVEAFYAGTRRLIGRVLADEQAISAAEQELSSTLGSPMTSLNEAVTQSGSTASAVTSFSVASPGFGPRLRKD